MIRKHMTDQEIRREGFRALLTSLGPAGAIRFLQQYESGRGDYARDRGKWLDSLSVDEVAEEIRRRKADLNAP